MTADLRQDIHDALVIAKVNSGIHEHHGDLMRAVMEYIEPTVEAVKDEAAAAVWDGVKGEHVHLYDPDHGDWCRDCEQRSATAEWERLEQALAAVETIENLTDRQAIYNEAGKVRDILQTLARQAANAEAVRTTDSHPNAIVIADILRALGPSRRLCGVWVHVHDDGTERARKGEVVVAIQYDRGSASSARALDGRGPTMRAASEAIAAALEAPTDE